MIFQHTWQQILAGDKVQTRRLVQEGDTFDTENGVITAVYRKGRLLYKVGQTRAVQTGRGKPSVGRIRLTGIRRQRVNEISEADAIAEGVEVVGREYDARTGQHASRYNAYIGGASTYNPVASFAGLFNQIHTGKDAYENGPSVWVLEFEREK